MSSTNASGVLPRGWWTDPFIAAGVRGRIAALVALGMNDQEVARAIGVSSKSVQRYRSRMWLPANAVNQYGARSGAPARLSRRKANQESPVSKEKN